MSTMEEPAGPQALAAELGRLQAELRQREKMQKAAVEEANRHQRQNTQKAAVEEANRRRRTATGRPEDWPLRDLSLKTVNGWFPKQRGSKDPYVPQHFQDLWSVVAVMLEWTERLPAKPSERRLLRKQWEKLHEEAQRGTSMDEEVRGYLEAARKAAEPHPYPGIPKPPSLAEVYVRQRSHPATRDGHALSGDGSAAGGSRTSLAVPSEPAEAVFRRAERVCVLIAGPGIGKSTLLRARLRDAAGEWLGGTHNPGKSGSAVPVWVSAWALTGEETQVPDVLAAATRLGRYGLSPGLARDRFLQRPWRGAHWLLLVDGLDELPNADERRAVLEKLANAVAADPPLYRCVVATRPLVENELSVLDRVLGFKAPHYELQPFTSHDLRTYIEKYFSTRWPQQQEAARRARHFAGALRSASLDELARTPLMAFMLCQLYLAKPERPLPDGRTAVYEAFTDLVYETNQSKRIAYSHEKSIKHLVENVQSPQARKEADAAARHVHERLPELIDYLAYRRLSDHETPVAEALASHEAVQRPGKIRPECWEAFLEGLLRHTGLLVHRADGLGFPHQTFLEYHAARHATRDEAARAQLLHDLFPHPEPSIIESPPQPPRLPPSYLGFLLDRLLGADSTAAETTRRLEILAERGDLETIQFLVVQVLDLKTNLPLKPIACRLRRLVEQPGLYDPFEIRVKAAGWLSMLDGYLEAGADLLIQRVEDDGARIWDRVAAAGHLGQVEGYQETAAAWLTLFIQATLLEVDERSLAAGMLARVEGYQEAGVTWLARFIEHPSLKVHDRIEAAKDLARVEGHQEAGVTWLARFAEDTSLKVHDRMQAAQGLTEVREQKAAGAAWLARFAEDDTADDYDRVWSAWQLALMGEYEETAATLLTRFVEETAFNGEDRIWAAWGLVQLDGHREAGIAWLWRFARDPALSGKAIERLAQVDKDGYASLLTSFAEETTLTDFERALAAWKLAQLDGHRQAGATWLARFIGSTETLSTEEALKRIFDLRVPTTDPSDGSAR